MIKFFFKPLADSLTPRKAAQIIVVATLVVTLAGGVLIWLLDHTEFPNLGTSLWWSLQTVTTVGYGDIVPANTTGRIIGAVLMLQGLALITVVAASVTATLIEQVRKRRNLDATSSELEHLKRIEARLDAIERALGIESPSAAEEPDERRA